MASQLSAKLCAIALVAIGGLLLETDQSRAQDYCTPMARQDLFYNYYAQPVPCDGYGGVPAQLYVSPRPTPPLVGHTYVTYQPLLPHEFLYAHHRTYYRYNGPHAGLTTTKVHWRHSIFPACWISRPPYPAKPIFRLPLGSS